MGKILKKGLGGVAWAFLLALVFAVALDAAAAVFFRPLPRLPWLIASGAVFVLFSLLPLSRRRLREDFFGLLGLVILAVLLSRALLFFLERSGSYPDRDSGKTALYGKQKVLVIVPREGDELCLAGGVLEGFSKYGSELSLLYTESKGEGVIAEALGVSPARVYEGDVLAAALAECAPTLVLADRAQQYVLTAAISELAKKPQVLYGLLWDEEADFYAENLLSCLDPGWYARSGLSWESRVRLPVEPSTLSHSLLGCREYQLLRLIGQEDKAESLVSGDRVFWKLGSASSFHFVKLSNAKGDYIYDYYIDPRGQESFPLVTCGKADQPYSVSVEGQHCAAMITQGRVLEVRCPKGRSCIVTVTSADKQYSDTVRITNAGRFSRETAQATERFLRGMWEEALPQTHTFIFVSTLRAFVRML